MPAVTAQSDLARLRSKLTPNAYRQLVLNGMRELGGLFLPVLRSEAPQGKTGDLRSGLRFEVNDLGAIVELRVFGPSYAKYVVGGTRPHVIEARNASALAFTVAGGTLVFAKRVQHPGTKPNDFVGRAWAIVRETALGRLVSGVASAFRGAA